MAQVHVNFFESVATDYMNERHWKFEGEIKTKTTDLMMMRNERDSAWNFGREIVQQIVEQIRDRAVDAWLAEHQGDLVQSIGLEDVKELALIKSANRLNEIWEKAVTDSDA